MNRAATALLCAALAAAPCAARASAADAFENKVKPVSGQLYTKAGKLELSLSGGHSLNDAFFSKWVGGGRLGYHFNEYVSLSAMGLFAATSPTGSTSVCAVNAGCRDAAAVELYQVPGQIRWIAGGEIAFAPVYGKLNVFAEKAIHFDLALFAGPAVVAYRDVLKRNPDGTVPANPPEPPTATTVGGHGGLGARIFLGRSIALRLDVRDVVYWVKNLDRGNLQQQLIAELGVSFLLGGGAAQR